MTEAKDDIRKFLEMDNVDEFNKLSNEELLQRCKDKLKKKMDENPNEMKTLIYPNNLLSSKCDPVVEFSEVLKTFARHLLLHCRRSGGIGLAAPQVGLLYRIIAIDTDVLDRTYGTNLVKLDFPDKLFNPVISNASGKIRYKEGCLSLPGAFGWVDRFVTFTLNYQDSMGTHKKLEVDCNDGPYGIVLQHEIDHLDGICFIDKLNFIDKDKVIKQVNKTRGKNNGSF